MEPEFHERRDIGTRVVLLLGVVSGDEPFIEVLGPRVS